jgi:transglutaminase-like putative cysteine protease
MYTQENLHQLFHQAPLFEPQVSAPNPAASVGPDLATVDGIQRSVRIDLRVDLQYEIDDRGADFVFNVHAARTPNQRVTAESLTLNQDVQQHLYSDPLSGNRYMRVRASPGTLRLSYAAVVDLVHHQADPNAISEVPVCFLPNDVIGCIFPSRYCQSDLLINLATTQFGNLTPGYMRVLAIEDWVRQHVSFRSNSSNSNTSAIDTLNSHLGVCRDFAHLMIALCRALNIPARFATGTDYGSDPALGPPDFQAYVEVYLGHRWFMFDPSGTAMPMGFVRFGTGRDAADVAFATVFGTVRLHAPVIRALAVADQALGTVLPHHSAQALSTDSGSMSLGEPVF